MQKVEKLCHTKFLLNGLSGTMEGEEGFRQKVSMSRGGVRKIVQALGPEAGTRDEAEKSKSRSRSCKDLNNGLNIIL